MQNVSENLQCESLRNLSTWKACFQDALDKEVSGIKKHIRTSSLVLMAIGVISSSLVCMVVNRIRRVPQRTISNALVLNLAISDVIFRVVFVVARFILPSVHAKASFIECKIILYSHYACAAVTFALLAGIAIDRYHQIVHPLKYFYMTKAQRIAVILFLWVYAYVVAIGFIFVVKDQAFHRSRKVPSEFRRFNDSVPGTVTFGTKKSKFCSLGKNSPTSQYAFTPYFIFGFLLPLVITIVAYMKIFWFLRKRSKVTDNDVATRSKEKALKMLVVLVGLFVVCWSPVMFVDLLYVYGELGQSFPLRLSVESFSHTSSILCPIVYGFGYSSFRKELRKMFFQLKVLSSLQTFWPSASRNSV